MAVGNTNFDQLLSTTLNNYRQTLEDNVFGNRPLVAWLKRKDRMRVIGGGVKIVEPLIYAENSSAKPYGEWDNLAITPQTGISSAEYPWKLFSSSVAISGLQELQNAGEAEIIDLLEAKVMQSEESIGAAFNRMFYGDGTTFAGSSNANAWLGLQALVGNNSTGPAVVGNIDCTDSLNTWWRSTVASGSGWSTATAMLAGMATAYNSSARGSDAPDAIFTTQAAFEKYESFLQPQLRFTDTATLDAGFQNLLFKTAPILFDTDAPTGLMFFLNSKYLKLVGHKSRWFTNTPFVRPTNQDARYSQILCAGNLTVSNRKRQSLVTSIP